MLCPSESDLWMVTVVVLVLRVVVVVTAERVEPLTGVRAPKGPMKLKWIRMCRAGTVVVKVTKKHVLHIYHL